MSDFQIETRRRSRSKTPFLRSGCDHESCEHAGEDGHVHHKKKTPAAAAPNVQTIIEETVEVTSSSSSPSAKLTQTKAQQKTKTSDYSSEDASPENKTINKKSSTDATQKQSSASSASTTTHTSTSTTIITKSKKVGGIVGYSLGSKAATSTPKGGYLLDSFVSQYSNAGTESTTAGGGRRQKEIAQNEINSQFERSQREANKSKSSRSFSRIFGNSYVNSAAANEASFTGDASDHIAYNEYKSAGEYWKKTPKTDYTYSELSPHRRVLAPGVVAMPNMSRRSLENHHERIDYMISRDPAQEEFIRRRYETSKFEQNRRDTAKLVYDSGDEVDYSQFDDYRGKQHHYNNGKYQQQTIHESWFAIFITTVVTSFTSVWRSVTGAGSAVDESAAFYRTNNALEERGFFGSIAHGIKSFGTGLFRYVYLFISSVLCLDTWLLQSSNAENKSKKRFLLLLLILLPLLLLAAWSLLAENERLYYLQRTQALLPLSLLASVKSALSSGGATLKGLLDGFQLPAVLNKNSFHVTSDDAAAEAAIHMANAQTAAAAMKKSLTDEEYENILHHIDSYVQQLVELKVQTQPKLDSKQPPAAQITPQQTQLIVQIMRENLERLSAEKRNLNDGGGGLVAALSDAEVQHLAQLVQLQLEASGWTHSRVALSPETIAQIRTLIQERLEVNNHAHYTLLVEKIDLDALLARILSAPQLKNYVDAAIDEKLTLRDVAEAGSGAADEHEQQQSALIGELSSEIAFIKLALSDKLSENEDLHQSISKMRLGQDALLQRMQQHESATDARFVKIARDELQLLMHDVGERLKREILLAVDSKQNASTAALKGQIRAALSEEEVRKLVKSVLSIYDADKTGLVDFALESAGGQILSTRCTESYQTKTAQISVFGIPLWFPTNTPRVAISPNVQPGECWAFQGFPGFLVLKLNSLVYVTGFTLEHIPKSLSPNGRIDSAPRNFTVWGLEHEKDQDPILFGSYEYADNDASLQYFPLQNKDIKRPYEIVELRMESNHGHAQYTCLYRFRVHGKPPAA